LSTAQEQHLSGWQWSLCTKHNGEFCRQQNQMWLHGDNRNPVSLLVTLLVVIVGVGVSWSEPFAQAFEGL
jgi:hypothetical protein